ncbi:alpha/beta hydrolase fold domain-containing protein [Candidatus Dojkabacteria bacterium]|nr:alpha/beta hydrolase fold domain-containing protein [Candidatus Dojkabacteria bacterium]
MTQINYFKIIFISLIFIFFAFNSFSFSELIINDSSSRAQDLEVRGIADSLEPDYTPFTITEGEIVDGVRKISDIKYINDSEESKRLDLFLPEKMNLSQKYPLIIYIHGGAWLEGNKEYFKDYELVKNDFIVASVDYRLSTEDLFPAQIHDIKAAIRWLKGNAKKYNIDSENIGAYGESAGGHLASLLGTTSTDDKLNGNVGLYLDQSTEVKAVVSEYGLYDLSSIADDCENNQLCNAKYRSTDSIVSRLLGCKYDECGEDLNSASPINYLSSNKASFLLLHGKKDEIVPYQQVENFSNRLLSKSIFVETIVSEEGKHIDSKDRIANFPEIINFFNTKLKNSKYYFCDFDTDYKETYSDITRSDGTFSAINKLECKNAFYGITNDNFEPDKKINRAEVARIIFNVFDQKVNTSCNNFSDVDNLNRNYIYIQSLKCSKLINGYEENEFKPDKTILQSELIAIISKIKDISQEDMISKIEQKNLDIENIELTRRATAFIISKSL